MDVDEWVKRGYIDIIITGRGYDPFTMPDDLIRRGHDWGVPVYRCFSNSAMAQELVQHSDLSGNNLGAWRAAAASSSTLPSASALVRSGGFVFRGA